MKKNDYSRAYTLPITIDSNRFIGKKPVAVLFGGERIDGDEWISVKTWREVCAVILKRCNADPIHHETLMKLRDRIWGRNRVLLSGKPDGMTRPLKIDEDMFVESHYGAATLLYVLTVRILKPVGFDCSNIRIVLKARC